MHILIKSQARSNFTQNNIELLERRGGEMADTPALEAGGSNPVEVQVLSPAPVVTCSELRIWKANKIDKLRISVDDLMK